MRITKRQYEAAQLTFADIPYSDDDFSKLIGNLSDNWLRQNGITVCDLKISRCIDATLEAGTKAERAKYKKIVNSSTALKITGFVTEDKVAAIVVIPNEVWGNGKGVALAAQAIAIAVVDAMAFRPNAPLG